MRCPGSRRSSPKDRSWSCLNLENPCVLADMSVHVRRESVLQWAAIGGGPAEEGAQLLTGVELECPALLSSIQVEASTAGAEGLIHLLQHAIQPQRGRGFVGSHPLSKAADKLLLLDTFGHSFPFTLYTSRATVYLSDPGNNART